MKNALLLALLFFVLVACSKKSQVDDMPKDIPAWLQTKIADIKKGNQSDAYFISEYKIDGVAYYNISLVYQSCMLCDVYNERGTQVTLALEKETKIERVRIIWPVIGN